MLPDPTNKKTLKASTTISMIPRATMNKITNVKEDPPKTTTTKIQCFKPKSVEVEDIDDDEQGDTDFLGLNKINEIPDVEPVTGFDLPEIKTIPIVEEDKMYGPVYCPESAYAASDLYEDDETKLTLDSNAVCFYIIYL